MKKVLVAATLALALVVPAAAPAGADPVRPGAVRAAAYGLLSRGLLAIGPLAPTSAEPPGFAQREAVLEVPPTLGLVADATVGSVSEAHFADDLRSKLAGRTANDPVENRIFQQNNNASGFASTDGLGLVLSPGTGTILDVLTDNVAPVTLVGAEAVDTEVVARCVNNRPVFDAGFNLLSLSLGGQDIPLTRDLLNQILDLLGRQPPEGETDPGPSTLAGILTVTRGVTNVLPDGTLAGGGDTAFIDGLRIDSDLLNLHIVVSHSEVTMRTPCGVERPRPTGPGPVAPTRALAATGHDMGTWPMVAFGVLGGAVILRRTMLLRSSRRAS